MQTDANMAGNTAKSPQMPESNPPQVPNLEISIRERFVSHKLTPVGQHRVEMITEAFITLGNSLEKLVPPSRERSLAIARLQEAKMWAVTGFAMHGDYFTPHSPARERAMAEDIADSIANRPSK